MCTKNLAKPLLVASFLTIGLSSAVHAGAWSEVFIPSNGSTQHASMSVCKRGGFDPYTDGTRMGPRDPYTDGGNHIGTRDAYTDGARSVGGGSACASRAD